MIIMIILVPLFLQLALDVSYHLPDSRKPSAVDVELTTNVGVLGRWIFRVDGNTVVPGRIFNQGLSDDLVHKMIPMCIFLRNWNI